MNRFTAAASGALCKAMEEAGRMGHTYIGSEHLLLGLLCEKGSAASRILNGAGVTLPHSRELIAEEFGEGALSNVGAEDMSPRVRKIIESSYMIAAGYGSALAATEHILLALLREQDCAALRIIEEQGASPDLLISEAASLCRSGSALALREKQDEFKSPTSPSLQRISEFGKDLTGAALAGRIDPVIGRESETSRMIRILSRRTKNNPVLIGEPGVGKTAVVEGLALRIAERSVPEALASKRIFALDLSSMIAGAKYRGDFEERLRKVLAEASANRNIVLFIDEIHTLLGAGSAEGAMDAANILKPVLARGDIQVIGATTLSEYRRIEKDAALERRFQSITVEEPDQAETLTILEGLRPRYEAHHGLKITDGALRAAVRLSVRYIPERRLPDKAIDLIDEAAAGAKIEKYSFPDGLIKKERALSVLSKSIESAVKNEDFESAAALRRERESLFSELKDEKESFLREQSAREVSVKESDVAGTVTEWTGIPASALDQNERSRLLRLEEKLKEKIIGQDDALLRISRAVRVCRSGVHEGSGTAGSFIFAGPAGVGKTGTARAVAEQIFGSEDALIRLDMSEYMERHSVSKLIGSPPGYAGYGEGGQLTEKVRRRPYSVLLFDEIEKAHPDVLNVLLQILDDGRLTDSEGKRISFKNCMVIMTTNIGSSLSQGRKQTAGFGSVTAASEEGGRLMQELSGLISPELLSRIDEVALFRPLSRESVVEITKQKLDELAKRLEKKGILPVFESGYAESLAELGYDPKQGARSIEKAVRRYTEADISMMILTGKAVHGKEFKLFSGEIGKITANFEDKSENCDKN